jgi:hypothetical protein
MGAPDPDAEAGGKPKNPPPNGREARLAKALRDNLRRRKAGLAADTASGEDEPAPR